MKQKEQPCPVDKTLTPENARQRGYVFVCDVLPEFLRENRELVATLAAEGCVLGGGSVASSDDALGLYQPLPPAAS